VTVDFLVQGNAPPVQAGTGASAASANPAPSASRAVSQPIAGLPERIRLSYKNGAVLAEPEDGSLRIYNLAARTVLLLNPGSKTYSETSWRNEDEAAPSPQKANGRKRRSGPAVQLDKIRQYGVNGEEDASRSIAEIKATEYTLSASFRRSGIKRGGRGFPGGGSPGRGRRRSGGAPGGGGMPSPGMGASGELWLADLNAFPAGFKDAASALIASLLPPAPVSVALKDALAKVSAFPLQGSLRMRRGRFSDSEEPPDFTFEALDVRTDPLDDALFRVPADYRRIEPPSGGPTGPGNAGTVRE
jgi:hypothetical protein